MIGLQAVITVFDIVILLGLLGAESKVKKRENKIPLVALAVIISANACLIWL